MTYVVRFATTDQERDGAYALRRSVFEVEQGIPRPLDRDVHDFNAVHAVALDDGGRCVGTGRIVRVDHRRCQLGRMAVAAEVRRHGVGAQVLDALERIARLRGLREMFVHAQVPAEPFYAKRGFARDGEVFLDQGVAHVLMRKPLVS